jgi:tRNA (pseudouridine54-N1)-methyltransferase
MRRFVIVGNKAKASPDFLLVDIPSTSGRLDVLLRGLRAGLLVSHGLRRDTVVYLVLQGDPSRVVTLRFDGAASRYMRPDDRSLASVVQKVLRVEPASAEFTEVRPGIAIARGGVETVLAQAPGAALHVLDELGIDMRAVSFLNEDNVFFLGDHIGLDAETRRLIEGAGERAISVGPVSLHTEDVVTLVHNELDRRVGAPTEPIA